MLVWSELAAPAFAWYWGLECAAGLDHRYVPSWPISHCATADPPVITTDGPVPGRDPVSGRLPKAKLECRRARLRLSLAL
jgi:hypothetical protein